MLKKHFNQDYFYYFALFIFASVGLYARFKGIGKWPLADDEYHTVESVRNILKHGVPAFECGGWYTRGILYQYFLASLNLLFNGNEAFVYRTANAVISLLAIPPIYIITKKVANKHVAIIALIIYLTSVWNVEYARYIRMYALFQVIFLWYVLCLYKVTIDRSLNLLKYLLALSVLGVLVYEEGIFLTAINILVPALVFRRSHNDIRTWKFLFLSLTILVISFIYLRTDFRHLSVHDYLPHDFIKATIGVATNRWGPFLLPHSLINLLPEHGDWLLAFSVISIVCIGGLIWINKYYATRAILFLSLLVAIFSILNIFTPILLLIAIYYFMSWMPRNRAPGRLYIYVTSIIIIYSIFWISFLLNTEALYHIYGNTVTIGIRKALVVLLKYPNFYDHIIHPWLGGMRNFSVLTASIIFSGLVIEVLLKREKNAFICQLFVLVLLICTMVSVTVQPYHNTRYTFLLYPLIIIITTYYLSRLVDYLPIQNYKNSILLVCAFGFVFISDDHDLHHLLNIDSKTVNYRIGYSTGKRFHLRNRMDVETPAQYINSHLSASDLVISSVRPVHHYLQKLDYYYITPEDSEFTGVSACGGTRELWTNAGLLYSDSMLDDLIQNNKGKRVVWLIFKSGEFPYPSSIEKMFYRKYRDNIAYLSIDRNIVVYRFNGS